MVFDIQSIDRYLMKLCNFQEMNKRYYIWGKFLKYSSTIGMFAC